VTSGDAGELVGAAPQAESATPRSPQAESATSRSPQAESATSRSRRTASKYARPVIAGLLLLAAFAGLGAFGRTAATRGPLHQHGTAVAIGLEVVLAALEAALLIIRRRRPHPPFPAAQLRMVLSRVAGVVMLAVAIIILVNLAAHRKATGLLQHLAGPTPSPTPTRGGSHRKPLSAAAPAPDLRYLLYAVLGLVLLAAIAACAVYLLRRLPTAPAGYEGEPVDEDTTLRQAVQSGRAALATTDDARRAIIACYVAMETSLARAGAARSRAETPDELLDRAASAGLLHGAAAARLTELFYEARFSSHTLPPAAIAEARQALDDISARLDRPRTVEASP
jgi:hypothetical protein